MFIVGFSLTEMVSNATVDDESEVELSLRLMPPPGRVGLYTLVSSLYGEMVRSWDPPSARTSIDTVAERLLGAVD